LRNGRYEGPDALSLTIESIAAKIRRIAASEVAPLLDDPQFWGDLAAETADDCRVLTDNEVANVLDLIDLALFDPSDLFEVSGRGAAQLVSSAYLTEHYGLENNARDLNKILRANSSKLDHYVLDSRIARASSRESTPSKRFDGVWSTVATLKLYYTPPQDVLTFFAYEAWVYGFSASASTIWDLIPFSFVVDWAVNLGDCFNRLDSQYFLSKVRQNSCVKSTLSTNLVDGAQLFTGLSGTLTVSVYHREVLSSLPDMPVRLEVTTPSPEHFWEGAALLVQQRRH
jgi:hypothetical protein